MVVSDWITLLYSVSAWPYEPRWCCKMATAVVGGGNEERRVTQVQAWQRRHGWYTCGRTCTHR